VHIALRMGLAAMLAAGSVIPADVLLIDESTNLDKGGVGYLAELLTHTGRQTLLVTNQGRARRRDVPADRRRARLRPISAAGM
jgi:hypothetical protein